MLSRGSASVVPVLGCPCVKKRSSTYAIQRSQRDAVVVEQPDAAGVALALLDERLDEDAEEAGDVRLADQQVERELDGVALDVRHALGAAALVDLARERVARALLGGPSARFRLRRARRCGDVAPRARRTGHAVRRPCELHVALRL